MSRPIQERWTQAEITERTRKGQIPLVRVLYLHAECLNNPRALHEAPFPFCPYCGKPMKEKPEKQTWEPDPRD